MIMLIVSIICVVSMIGLIPLLLKLKPISNIRYLDENEDGIMKMDEDLEKCFDQVKLVKNQLGEAVSLVIYPNEKTRSVDLTIATTQDKKVRIKGFKIKFKFGEETTINFNHPVHKVAIYVNRVNDGVKQQHIIQSVAKANVESFIGLEWACSAIISCILISDYIMHSYLYIDFINGAPNGYYFILCCLFVSLICIGMYFVLRYAVYWYLGKYIYGGKFDARN